MESFSEEVIRVKNFDGQTIYDQNNVAIFEVSNFLGGGAAGNVYEALNIRSKEHYALKILNPLGRKVS